MQADSNKEPPPVMFQTFFDFNDHRFYKYQSVASIGGGGRLAGKTTTIGTEVGREESTTETRILG